MRLLALDHRAQRRAIEHVDHVAAMRDLHRRCIGVAIARDHLDAEALELDHDLFAELAGAEHQDTSSMRTLGSSDRHAVSYHGLTCSRVKIRGIDVPDFMYGTAWKESRTQGLVELALREGFRAIDTANQRKHYFEEAVGKAIAGGESRSISCSSKPSSRIARGQDERLPYDEDAPIATQVAQSYESSVAHLGKIDSYVLHGPCRARSARGRGSRRVASDRGAAGRARRHQQRHRRSQLEELVAFAKVPPAFVQNRCYASAGWDREVRAVCAHHGIVYQGFSLLTANRDVVHHDRDVRAIAARLGVTTAQLVFAFARQRGMLPLTGTTSAEHMRLDLASSTIDPRRRRPRVPRCLRR